jgi:hypothetical protein
MWLWQQPIEHISKLFEFELMFSGDVGELPALLLLF